MNHPEKKETGPGKEAGGGRWISGLLRSRPFRAAVSLGLLALILTRLNLGDLGETLSRVQPGLLMLGILVFLVTNMASVFKWRIIIQAQQQMAAEKPVSYFYLTSLFYMGLFFNNFLPTNFGGDVVKVWRLSKITGQPMEAAGSVVMDRASSTFALLLIAVAPALMMLGLLGKGLGFMVLAMFLILLLTTGFFASERAARKLGRFSLLQADPFGLRMHLKNFYYSLHEFRRRPLTLAVILVISLLYQGLHVVTVYVLALSLGIHVALIYYFLFIPVVLAAGMVPVSVNGIGVREGAWVLLFSQVGVSAAEAFSMSVLTFMVLTIVSLAGGAFYLFDRAVPDPNSLQPTGDAENNG